MKDKPWSCKDPNKMSLKELKKIIDGDCFSTIYQRSATIEKFLFAYIRKLEKEINFLKGCVEPIHCVLGKKNNKNEIKQ